ncbi:hypothetical protein BASA81_008886 [Batrachochytrium salamandrivorans]|nr:hypothetical protein BASA81_008886 [Batrachochytrium salamandrivorans]
MTTPNPFDTFVQLYEDGKFRLAVRIWSPTTAIQSTRNCLAYPGWMDNAGSFDTLAPMLCNKLGITIAVVDPPGCGWSDHHPSRANSYADFEEPVLLFQLANALGWDQFGLLAHSRGGAISTLAAGLYPNRVQFLIVLDSSLSLSGMLGADVMEAQERFSVRRMQLGLDHQKYRVKKTFPTLDGLISASMSNAEFPKTRQTATNIVMRHVRPSKGGWTYIHDNRLYGSTQFVHISEQQMREFIVEITCPVLLVHCQDHFAKDHCAWRTPRAQR